MVMSKRLEVGCGTGRILEELVKVSRNVTGVDVSDLSLEIAGCKLSRYVLEGSLKLINHNFCLGRMNSNVYSKVFVTFQTYNHILAEEIDFLKNINFSMKEKGEITLHILYPKKDINPDSYQKERHFIFYDKQLAMVNIDRTYEGDIEQLNWKVSCEKNVEEFSYSTRTYTNEDIYI